LLIGGLQLLLVSPKLLVCGFQLLLARPQLSVDSLDGGHFCWSEDLDVLASGRLCFFSDFSHVHPS
jgi:hypothetical protein